MKIMVSENGETDNHFPDIIEVLLEELKLLLVGILELTEVAWNVAKPGEEVNFPDTGAKGTAETDKAVIDRDYFGVIVTACSLPICESQGDSRRITVG